MVTISKDKILLIAVSLGWFAVVMQFVLMLQNRVESVAETTIRFFSFFTILTNSLVTVYFTILWFKKPSYLLTQFKKPGFLTATTLYITVVSIVYQLVLRGIWEPTGMQKAVDELLHTVIPIYVIVFWFMYENKKEVLWKSIPSWMLYPFVYLVCILFRGTISGFYPYPFVNVNKLGIEKVLINSGFLVLFFIAMAVAFVGIGKLIAKASNNKAQDF